MAQTNVSIRVDEEIKKDAENLFAKLGLTLSAATNVFYRQAVRTQGIPFPLTMEERNPQKKALQSLKEAFQTAQNQSLLNGTDSITMDEIDEIIKECRQEASVS
ncbi:MAG: type II toxin-antitoxin system RelB/DinJ family antitoxin [Defluviitaleaceae bacterium]|nr:type II toxin-antitoxin system RelB/DinJ family antitoxin [Defluviitaleaceae bacterium]MCL2275896.1 type II toxin-antitoxin system RelB/DinJ family antitoxin [Defluviitaleaceae bacterium]